MSDHPSDIEGLSDYSDETRDIIRRLRVHRRFAQGIYEQGPASVVSTDPHTPSDILYVTAPERQEPLRRRRVAANFSEPVQGQDVNVRPPQQQQVIQPPAGILRLQNYRRALDSSGPSSEEDAPVINPSQTKPKKYFRKSQENRNNALPFLENLQLNPSARGLGPTRGLASSLPHLASAPPVAGIATPSQRPQVRFPEQPPGVSNIPQRVQQATDRQEPVHRIQRGTAQQPLPTQATCGDRYVPPYDSKFKPLPVQHQRILEDVKMPKQVPQQIFNPVSGYLDKQPLVIQMQSASNWGKRGEIDKFYGEDKPPNPSLWLNLIDNYQLRCNLTSEQMLQDLPRAFLPGSSELAWYMKLYKSLSSYEEFKDKFRAKYVHIEEEEDLEQALRRATPKPEEDGMSFIKRLELMNNSLQNPLSSATLASIIRSNIHLEIRQQLSRARCPTLEEIRNEVRHQTKILELMKVSERSKSQDFESKVSPSESLQTTKIQNPVVQGPVQWIYPPQFPSGPLPPFCFPPGPSSFLGPPAATPSFSPMATPFIPNTKFVPQVAPSVSSSVQNSSSVSSNPRTSTPKHKVTHRRNTFRGRGHARGYWPRRQTTQDRTSCYTCHQPGHWARDCPRNNPYQQENTTGDRGEARQSPTQ